LLVVIGVNGVAATPAVIVTGVDAPPATSARLPVKVKVDEEVATTIEESEAVTVYVVEIRAALNVPVIAPVLVLNESEAGSDGDIE
jgi:hypothetical protein